MLLLWAPLLLADLNLRKLPMKCPTEQRQHSQSELRKESEMIQKRSKASAKLYKLKKGEDLKDVTAQVLEHKYTDNVAKQAIKNKERRYYVFTYPSDGLTIKAFVSIPVGVKNPPVIMLVRGGNREFGLPHPGQLSAYPGYALIATTNRGGVSEGQDEFGGNDVNDLKNLFDYLPTLEKKINVTFNSEKIYMVGASRGGMQLFLALGRYPELQQKVRKVVSISGLLNMKYAIERDKDFQEMLSRFGYQKGKNSEAWIAKRQPLNYVNKVSKDLPIMIAQGSADTRVCVREGYDMLEALHKNGNTITYVEVEGGNHVLNNTVDFLKLMINWFEQD
ncbi:MAG TPA: prolyl oligopeptidase family serine peptidase [Candidatus Berkiella sp.]|nr:prolyl oligopeptidase family serine peptidase [Candidatus Berkiella sp.]